MVGKSKALLLIGPVKAFATLTLLAMCLASAIAQPYDFIETDFTKADSVAELYPRHSLKNLVLLTANLTRPFDSDVEKFRAIYKWVCNNIDSDYELSARNQENRRRFINDPEQLRNWNNTARKQSIDNLLRHYRTVCTGYAYLLREMCSLAGIECVAVDGYGRTIYSNLDTPGIANHSWNAVRLNGKWYLCDATWAAGAYHPDASAFIREYDDAYFLTQPELFIAKHYPLDIEWALFSSPPSLDDFLTAPVVYAVTIRHGITDISPSKLKLKVARRQEITFQFTSSGGTFKRAFLEVTRSNYLVENKKFVLEDNTYKITYSFRTKGRYDVQVLVDGEFVVSYEVTVK